MSRRNIAFSNTLATIDKIERMCASAAEAKLRRESLSEEGLSIESMKESFRILETMISLEARMSDVHSKVNFIEITRYDCPNPIANGTPRGNLMSEINDIQEKYVMLAKKKLERAIETSEDCDIAEADHTLRMLNTVLCLEQRMLAIESKRNQK